MTGELSEGPSGPSQAGYEHAGYAPGYGEADDAWAGPGGRGGVPPPVWHGPGLGGEYGRGPRPPGAYPGAPRVTYGPTEPAPPPWGKAFGIGCGVLLLLLLIGGGCTALGIFVATAGAPRAEEPGEFRENGSEPTAGAEVRATQTTFEPSRFHSEGEYTSVEVSITNTGDEEIDINPLYFTVVDGAGVEHPTTEAVAMDEQEIGVRTLGPGQSATGAVTVRGDVEADRVVFDPVQGAPVEARVN